MNNPLIFRVAGGGWGVSMGGPEVREEPGGEHSFCESNSAVGCAGRLGWAKYVVRLGVGEGKDRGPPLKKNHHLRICFIDFRE